MLTPENLFTLALALLTGGVGVKIVEAVFGSGKRLRDELRKDLSRLENRVKELDVKVDQLEAEIEQWKDKAEEWRNRFFIQQEQYHQAVLRIQRKAELIRRLRYVLRVVSGYVPNPPPKELVELLDYEQFEHLVDEREDENDNDPSDPMGRR